VLNALTPGRRLCDGTAFIKVYGQKRTQPSSGCNPMKIKEIREVLKAELLVGEDQLEQQVSGGGGADLMEDVLAAVADDAVLLTGLTTGKVLRTAQVAGVAAIVFVRGKRPGDDLVAQAGEYRLPLMLTEFSLFVACGRLYMNGLRGLDGSW
jgi:predicted transcriptional regulator